MADTAPTTPAEPTPAPTPAVPATPAKIAVGQAIPAWLKTTLIVMAIVLIPLVGDSAYRYFHQPGPAPAPSPAADTSPRAVVSGMFLAVQPSAPQASPNAPPAPIGMFRLDASASKSAGPIRWKVRGPGAPPAPTTFDPAGKPRASIAEVIVTEPGPYRFDGVATGTSPDGLPDADVDSYSYTVTTPGPTPPVPDPTPGPLPPNPAPAPTPTPKVAGKFWAVAVFDTGTLAGLPPGQRAVFSSPTIIGAVSTAGGYWKHFDAADPLVASTAWGKAAIAAGLPALVYVDEKGAVVKAGKLPADEPAIAAEIKSLTGK